MTSFPNSGTLAVAEVLPRSSGYFAVSAIAEVKGTIEFAADCFAVAQNSSTGSFDSFSHTQDGIASNFHTSNTRSSSIREAETTGFLHVTKSHTEIALRCHAPGHSVLTAALTAVKLGSGTVTAKAPPANRFARPGNGSLLRRQHR